MRLGNSNDERRIACPVELGGDNVRMCPYLQIFQSIKWDQTRDPAALASLNLINQTAYPSAQNSSGTHYPCMGWTVAPASIRLQPIKTALCGRPEDILLHLWQADLRFYPLMFADILLKGDSTCLAWSGIFCLFVCVSVFAFILRLDHLVTFFYPTCPPYFNSYFSPFYSFFFSHS